MSGSKCLAQEEQPIDGVIAKRQRADQNDHARLREWLGVFPLELVEGASE